MHPFFLISPPLRSLFAPLVIAGLVCVLPGCAGSRYAPGPDFSPQTHDYLRADDTAAFNACVVMCEENTALALVTRTGCLEGCARARDTFPLRDKAFSSRRECRDALLRQDVAREFRIREIREWCDAKWSHVHNRKGCYRAAEIFYAGITPASVCGGDAAGSAAYGDSPALAREAAAPSPPEPVPAPGPVPEAVPTPAPPPVAPSGAVPAILEDSSQDRQVIRSTQPAGSLEPPPYMPAQQAPGRENAPIIDTPKYQKPIPAPKAQGKTESGRTEPATRKSSAAKPDAASAAPVASPPRTEPVLVPPIKTPEQTAPVPWPDPAAPAPLAPPSEPAPRPQQAQTPEPPTAQPEAPPAEPAKPVTETPAPASPARQPPASAIPAPSVAQETPPAAAPVPAPAQGGVSPAPGPGETPARTLPRPHLPMPPANSGQPPAPETKPSTATPPMLMPPLPSMLHQPYEVPTLISPQIEAPPEQPSQ